MIGSNPGILLKLAGYKHGSMSFHPSIKNVGLHKTPDAPLLFKDFLCGIIKDWDFDNICAAHMGNKVGDAKKALQETLDKAEKLFSSLVDRNKNNGPMPKLDEDNKLVVSGNECG
jgi:hypothetical protein